jgi:hypothetical protein
MTALAAIGSGKTLVQSEKARLVVSAMLGS